MAKNHFKVADISFTVESEGELPAIVALWAPTPGAAPEGGFTIELQARHDKSDPREITVVEGGHSEPIPFPGALGGCIDLDRQQAWFAIPPMQVYVSSALRLAFATASLRRSVLWFHSIGFRRGDRAFVLPGRSGVGKSTLGRTVTRQNLLGDDTVAVRVGAAGSRAYSTPFQSTGAALPDHVEAPLAGVYLLEQGPQTRFRGLAASAALPRLWRCILSPERSPTAQKHALGLLSTLLGQVPSGELTCALEPGVLDALPSDVAPSV
jgi:hypothetical protein